MISFFNHVTTLNVCVHLPGEISTVVAHVI